MISQQTQAVHPMLSQCWASVGENKPTLSQHWVNILCSLVMTGKSVTSCRLGAVATSTTSSRSSFFSRRNGDRIASYDLVSHHTQKLAQMFDVQVGWWWPPLHTWELPLSIRVVLNEHVVARSVAVSYFLDRGVTTRWALSLISLSKMLGQPYIQSRKRDNIYFSEKKSFTIND